MGQEYNENVSLIHIPSTLYDAMVGPSSLWFFLLCIVPLLYSFSRTICWAIPLGLKPILHYE